MRMHPMKRERLIEQEFIHKHHIRSIRDYLSAKTPKAIVTTHFALRLFQRCTTEERMRIIREIHSITADPMFKLLFDNNSKSCDRYLVANEWIVAAKLVNNKMYLKTIFRHYV